MVSETKNYPLKLVLMTPLTICESVCENTAGGRCSYTLASKLMDQLKAFVGMAIFLSQMATSRGITSVSNSALISARFKSPEGNGPTLDLSPQCGGSSWRARGQQWQNMLFCTYYSSHTVPAVWCMLEICSASTAEYPYWEHVLILRFEISN